MAIPVRLLILQKNQNTVQAWLDRLRQANFAPEPRSVNNRTDFEKFLKNPSHASTIDVILADPNFPDLTPSDILQLLKQGNLEIPLILIGGSSEDANAIHYIEQGVSDCLGEYEVHRLGRSLAMALKVRSKNASAKKNDLIQTKSGKEGSTQEPNEQMRISNLIPFDLWTCSPDGGVIFLSDPFLQLLRSLESRMSPTLTRKLSSEEIRKMVAIWKLNGKQDSYRDYEHRFIEENGQYRTILSRGIPIKDSREGAPSWVGINLDITERKQAEEALQTSEERFRSLVEAIRDYAIFMLDTQGTVLTWNRGAEQLLGYQSEEIIGRNYGILFTEEDIHNGKPHREMEKAEMEGRSEDESWRIRKDGTSFWANEVITALHDKSGNLRGYSKITRDLTDRRQKEEEIRRLNVKLEERVQERTAELSAAYEELEAFAYSVSHDLRSPLRAISGFSDILLTNYSQQLPDEAQNYLRMVSDNAKNMGMLIDGLLSFSRLNRQPLNKRLIAPVELVQQALKELRSEQEGRHIEIQVGKLPSLQGDPLLLKQVFVNLLSNALKFTRQRHVARIEVGSREIGGETIYFVKDNGIGFNMQHSNKLFGVFQRLHAGDEYEGTGLGLALVQRIIQRHNGRIWAEAAVDQGATFYFTIGPNIAPAKQPTNGSRSPE